MNQYAEAEKWPPNVIPIAQAREWIASVLPGQPSIVGPTKVYAAKADFGVTARFAVEDASGKNASDVVFKANVYAGFSGAPFAFDLLSRHCKGQVPDVLAWREREVQSCILMRPFEGQILSSIRTIPVLQEMARTLAQIQLTVAALPAAEVARLPSVTLASIPDLFDELVINIETNVATVWSGNEKLSGILEFPAAELPLLLKANQAEVVDWVRDLESCAWPDSICHGDLHAENAVLQTNDAVLIYDWEDAFFGCPALSLERLLVQAWNWDAGGQTVGPWGYIAGTVGQTAVRAAYIEALPFGTPASRQRACALALCLAVIREAHAEWQWALSVDWPDGNPEWTAQLMNRLFQHRDALNLLPESTGSAW